MAILRRGRRGRAGSSPDAPPPRTLEPAPGPALDERLRQIAATTAAPEEALEPALRAILEATSAQAGAICLFDPRYALMRLATESGLSDEGCKRLRSVQRGDPHSWDIPLHGLLNRRAYLIESASRNRYVPALVEDTASVRTVTCIPLYGGATPLGSLILIALAPRFFTERDIRVIEGPLRELSAIIETARRRGSADEMEVVPPPLFAAPSGGLAQAIAERDRLRAELAARDAERARLAAELAAREAERAALAAELTTHGGDGDRLRAALDAATEERIRLGAELARTQKDAERAGTLAASLGAAEQERVRLAAALEAAVADRSSRARTTTELEQALAEAGRTVQTVRVELEAMRRTLDGSTTTAAARESALAAEIDHLRTRLQETETAAARESTLVRAHEQKQERLTLELRAAAAREQQLRDELRATSEQTLSNSQDELRQALAATRTAEEERAAAIAELDAARTALESAQSVIAALEAEATHGHGEIERLETDWRAAHAAQERLEAEARNARAQEEAAAARIAEITREIGTLRSAHDRGVAGEREAEATRAALGARLESLAAERDALREALGAATAERDRLAAEGADTGAARARMEEALARETTERTRLAAALVPLQEALGVLESAQARHHAEAAERTMEIARLRVERDQLAAERSAALTAQAIASAEAPPPGAPEPRMRVVTMTPVPAGRARAREHEPGRAVIVVLDADETWQETTVDDHRIVVVAPGEDVAARLREIDATRVVANLAAPGTLAALVALRAAGSTARFWGCLAAPAADRALALGMVEPAVRPIDPDAILTVLGKYVTRGTRVVTAGADVDALMSLRQALSRGGMSVSMAWDANQATDLLGVVKPEVVVIDLELPRREGYNIVARLATAEPIPSAVLIPGGGDAAGAFAAILAQPVYTGRCVSIRRVLSGALGRSEAPPTEQRPKVRALTRK